MRSREAESRHLLARLAGADVYSDEVNVELSNIKEALAAQSAGGGFQMRELFTNGPSQNLRRTLLGIAAQFFQQICGINLIVSCSNTFLSQDQKSPLKPDTSIRPTTQPTSSRIHSVSAPICRVSSPRQTAQSTFWQASSRSR
jgi:hypothetical protein